MTAASRPSDPLPRLLKLVSGAVSALVFTGVLTVPVPGAAQERVDLFDAQGRRTGYAIVDRQTGRVDFYDVNSRRTGWGRVERSGRVERFNLQGRRLSETALPIWTDQGQRNTGR